MLRDIQRIIPARVGLKCRTVKASTIGDRIEMFAGGPIHTIGITA